MTATMPILHTKNLKLQRNSRDMLCFDDISLVEGELLQITGANGAGKTTLLQMVAGLLQPSSGEIMWCNETIEMNRSQYFAELLYVGHLNGLKRELTVAQNLQLMPHSHGKKTLRSYSEALECLGLENFAKRLVQQLSAGQQRRVSLAKLLMFNAKLWILDEPFTALDQPSKLVLERCMQNHLQQQGMIIITTHQALTLQNIVAKQLVLGS